MPFSIPRNITYVINLFEKLSKLFMRNPMKKIYPQTRVIGLISVWLKMRVELIAVTRVLKAFVVLSVVKILNVGPLNVHARLNG